LNLLIVQERSDIAANVAIRLGRHNPKLYLQFTRVQLAPQWLYAFEHDGEAKLQACEVSVEVIPRDARSLAVLPPNLRNRQPRHVLDPSASDDGADRARRVDERQGTADRILGEPSAQLDGLYTFYDLRRVFRADAKQDVSASCGIHQVGPRESRVD
jgi:hypothetical protein